MSALARTKSAGGRVAAVLNFRPADFAPVIGLKLGLTDPVSGMNMGETAELLAREFEISREEQDLFALASHKKAAAARETEDARLQAGVDVHLGGLYSEVGRFADARSMALVSLDFARDARRTDYEGVAHYSLAYAQLLGGQLPEALESSTRATRLLESLGNEYDFYGETPVQIKQVQIENERMPKELFFIPALILLLGIVLIQRRRATQPAF